MAKNTHYPLEEKVWLAQLQKGRGIGQLQHSVIPINSKQNVRTVAKKKKRKAPAKMKHQYGKGLGVRPRTPFRKAMGPMKAIKRKVQKKTVRKKKKKKTKISFVYVKMANNNTMIDENSEVVMRTELDLFSVPPTTIDVERNFWEEVRPTNPITDHGPYEFFIVGNDHYIDMSANYIYLKFKIVHMDGANTTHEPIKLRGPADSPPHFVAPINLIGATFFKQVKMIINGRLTYDSGPDYAHLAYMMTDLNYDSFAKQTHLESAGYYIDCDTTFTQELSQLSTWKNPGAQKRYARHRGSRSVEYMAALHIPFARQERYLLNHLDIRFELHRVSDAFALQTINDEMYKIIVEDMKLYVRKVELTRALSMAIETQLQRMPVKYPVRRMEIKTLHIGYGRRTTPTNTMWNGQLPRRVIMCTIRNPNYFGGYDKNPFLFAPNHVIKACLYVNGKCVPYSGPLETRFHDGDAAGTSLVTRAYTQLYTAMGIGLSNKSNNINLHRFTRDACYFAFDLSVDNTNDSSNWELLRTGTISIYLEFTDRLNDDDGLRVLVLGEFDNLITIDKLRQIQYDYVI